MNGSRAHWARRTVLILIPLGVAANIALALASPAFDWSRLPLMGLAGAVGLAILPWFVSAARMVLWARFVGTSLRYVVALRVVLGGIVGSAVTPTGSGAGAIKWGLATRRGVSPGAAASLLAVEILEEAAFFAVALPIVALTAATEVGALRASLLDSGGDTLSRIAMSLTLGALGCLVLGGVWIGSLKGWLGPWLRRHARRVAVRLRQALLHPWEDAQSVLRDVARRGRGWLVVGLGLTALQWGLRYSVAWAVLAAFEIRVPPLLSWALQWLTQTLAGLVPTPGGAGGAEGAFAVLYAAWVPIASLGLAVAAWRLALYYVPLLIASLLLALPWATTHLPSHENAAEQK
ncbi:MAG: hypothetical protein Rubg2KO_00620 [Rubricoccaceae bacterium]